MSGAFDVRTAWRSDGGRRERNEDRAVLRANGRRVVALVADGAGGHADGAEASRRAAARIERALDDAGALFTRDALDDAVLAAHAEVRSGREATDGSGGGSRDGAVEADIGGDDVSARMHSTVVVLWLDTDRASCLWSHVGDSRLYRVRGGRAEALTVDDSVVQRMVDAQLITAAQAEQHPKRSQLIAALGIDGAVEPHTSEAAEPLVDEDAYLLCSDGWWGALDADAIAESRAAAPSPDDWLAAMQAAIEARADPRQDNFSAVAVWVHASSGETTRPMSTL